MAIELFFWFRWRRIGRLQLSLRAPSHRRSARSMAVSDFAIGPRFTKSPAWPLGLSSDDVRPGPRPRHVSNLDAADDVSATSLLTNGSAFGHSVNKTTFGGRGEFPAATLSSGRFSVNDSWARDGTFLADPNHRAPHETGLAQSAEKARDHAHEKYLDVRHAESHPEKRPRRPCFCHKVGRLKGLMVATATRFASLNAA